MNSGSSNREENFESWLMMIIQKPKSFTSLIASQFCGLDAILASSGKGRFVYFKPVILPHHLC